MNAADLMRYRWRAISHFGAAAFPAVAGTLAAAIAKGPITATDTVIATVAGLGSGFVALRALFDQEVDTTKPAEAPPSP